MKEVESMQKLSRSAKIFQVFNITFLGLLALSMLLPIIHVIAKSMSGVQALINSKVGLLPVDFTLLNYAYVLNNDAIMRAFAVTIYITVVGTLINLVMTSSLAYPLSREEYKGRKIFLVMVLLTMIFPAPLIPLFILVKELELMNTLWALMIPGAISAFNFFVMRSFFQEIPKELIEASQIDGCGETRILWNIIVPLAKPVMATVGLFYAVVHWNTYMHALYFINEPRLYPLQVKLRQMLMLDQVETGNEMFSDLLSAPEGIQMATVIVAMIPIIIVYPFIQRYFVKGMMLGSIK
jgi:putative aldouronate transport system permease protein